MKKLYFISLLLVIYACGNANKYDTFTRKDTPSFDLVAEKVYDFDNDFNLEKLIVYNDSIWIKIFQRNPLSKNLIQFCNIRDTSKNKGYFTYGKAGMELLSAITCLNDNFLVVNDINQGNKMAIFNMDSVFNNNYIPKMLKNIPLSTNNFILKNGDILMENRYFFEHRSLKQKFNIGAERIIRLEKNKNYYFEQKRYEIFTASYGDMTILANEKKNRIITAGAKVPEITIMDTLLNVKRVIVGPEKFDYELKVGSNKIFLKGKYDAYANYSAFKTDEYIYLPYRGNLITRRASSSRTEKWSIIKMDWDGNAKHIYNLEGQLGYLRIINGNEMYGTTFIDNKHFLVKYTLPD